MKRRLMPVLVGLMLVAVAAMPAVAMAQTTTYHATLDAINHSNASGSVTLQLNGNRATITEHVTGLAATFNGAPYPHVQHIHGGGQGVCPDMSADKNGDGVISTTEGMAAYGMIQTTLSKTGDTSPQSGTNVKIAPSGSTYTYTRTIDLSDATVKSLQSGVAVVVVHGLDPSTLSKQAQGEKSDLVPSLPLAATSPTLCGTLVKMPSGGVGTGGGSTSGIEDLPLFGLSAALLVAAGGFIVVRRRLTHQQS